MIALSICKNLCRACPRKFAVSLVRPAAGVVFNGSVCADRADFRLSEKPIFQQQRLYSGESQATCYLKPLCDFPIAMWPGFFKTINNFFVVNLVVRQQFDKEFDINEFMTASKQAIEIVSQALAREDYEQLEGLVTSDVIQSLRQKISTLDSQQKELIAVKKEDIHMAFPYEVGIMHEGEKDRERKFVEITVVAHLLRGLAQMTAAGESPPLNMGVLPEYQKRIFVCNYRFQREYTKGVDAPWIINVVNHFMPIALVEA